MASAVAELEAGLQGMLALKPPGVSGSRITNITALCVANVQSESLLIQKLFTHFKKTPGTHKLGVLYVVDSVTRKWLDQAKAQGQTPSLAAPDGTFAAGVHRVTELIPILMNDIIATAPEDQKEKIKKLVDIWEKGQTFPASMVNSFKEKLNAPRATNESTTPPGSPPPNLLASLGPGSKPVPPPNPAIPNILDTLASIARQNATSAQSNPSLAAPAPASAPPAPLPVQAQPSMPFLPTSQPAAPPVNVPALPFAFPPPVPPAQVPPAAGPAAPAPLGGSSNPAAATVQLVAALAAQGLPIDKIASVIQMMGQGGAVPQVPPPQMPQPAQTGGSPRSRANDRSLDYGRPGSPPGRGRLDRDRDHGRGYRQRSPPGRRGDSPPGSREPFQQEKWVEYDNTLRDGHIRVYSRTLFVGGVTCSENELREIFNRFGQVQTCIVNKDKRHAFVKMYFRKDAEKAKSAMEDPRNQEFQLRTRWGVGFGPRDCSDYNNGISTIPINKLTEADRKWMLTAPFGGSGGRPIVTGLCVEEPDIEIGAGVSSKAISRRMQTDKSGNHGPKSSRREEEPIHPGGGGGGGAGGGRWRHRDKPHRGHDQKRDDRNDKTTGNDDPIVMDLPAGITMGPNGINYPPNFAFGATANP
ncbi:hypothetical protein MFIFM68171_03217 [Madurella fahalii]|uniref:Uncharacterized protein n=1 Tax=Madurella fahalii TaxID=1157608 RepID=A0ABQ0G5K1_9PEZI